MNRLASADLNHFSSYESTKNFSLLEKLLSQKLQTSVMTEAFRDIDVYVKILDNFTDLLSQI